MSADSMLKIAVSLLMMLQVGRYMGGMPKVRRHHQCEELQDTQIARTMQQNAAFTSPDALTVGCAYVPESVCADSKKGNGR
jgi:hypothetical protein